MAGTCGGRCRTKEVALLNRVLLSSANMASKKGSHRHRHDVESDSAVETFPCYAVSERTANTVVVVVEDIKGPKSSWWRRMPSKRRAKILLFLLLLIGAAIVGVTVLLCPRSGIIPGRFVEGEAQSAADARLGDEAGQVNPSAFLPGEWIGEERRECRREAEEAETGMLFSTCFRSLTIISRPWKIFCELSVRCCRGV